EHELLRRGGTDDLAEPSEMGWAPGGAACVTDIVPQEKGFPPKLGGLHSTDGICTRPAQVPHGCILTRRDVDRGEVPRAHQACQFESVTTVGCDPIPGLFGDQGGRDAPTDMAFCGEIAGEPRATRPRCIDTDAGGAFGL